MPQDPLKPNRPGTLGVVPGDFPRSSYAVEADGLRILILEDDVLLGRSLAADLNTKGCRVIGPLRSLEAAELMAAEAEAAILDIAVGDQTSFDLAQSFRASRRPFLFYTGHPLSHLPPPLLGASLHRKPSPSGLLLDDLLEQRRRAQDPDPLDLIPEMRVIARGYLKCPAAADRLIEAVLRNAIRDAAERKGADLRHWLLDRLHLAAEHEGKLHQQ